MNAQTEAMMSLIAALLVLFSAMLDPHISAALAVIVLIAFSTYTLHKEGTMTPQTPVFLLGKLIVSAAAFVIGLMAGGMIAGLMGLPTPTLPPEMDANAAMITTFATSPLLVLALYLVGRKLAGGWLARTLLLSLLAWIAYTLNTAIEAVIFTSYVSAPWFTLVNFTPGVLLCAGATAWLFPAQLGDYAFGRAWKEHFQRRPAGAWVWRLLVAAAIFMPIYYLFGMLVEPFVGDYYRQGAFGMAAPPLSTLLPVLFLRSALFLVACLPVVVAWRGTARELWLSLGVALFILVGLLYMLAGNWLPIHVRVIHSLEILADSMLYAGALVWLLANPGGQKERSATPTPFTPSGKTPDPMIS